MQAMLRIGTSGWVYPHWVGRFYPRDLPAQAQLSYYARHFSTVEINASFYRLPTRAQFQSWAQQTADAPGFVFAVKASRYITHLKKLRGVEDALARLFAAAEGLGDRLGPFLYQLPPHWLANPERLAEFLALLPRHYRAAFEFRDPTWFQPEALRPLRDAGCALVIAIGGAYATPADTPQVGPFSYLRFHTGQYGTGFTDGELAFWAERIARDMADGRDVYVYFNNDADGHAIEDAQRLRAMLKRNGR
jgi:uncharacterized protein YecE (DUF72 family)